MAQYERRGRLADAVQDAVRPPQMIIWEREGGNAHDLIGATLTGTIRNKNVERAIAGSLTIYDTDVGGFVWDFDPADVADDGTFYVQFTAAYGDGRTPARSYEALWAVRG